MANWNNKQTIQVGGWWGWTINSWTFNVDFWTNTTNLYQKSVTVSDTNIQTASRPIISLYNSGWREIDELEWVDFTAWVSAISNWTSFTVFVDDKNRVAEWIYTFSYQF